jgi:hypothetical protein
MACGKHQEGFGAASQVMMPFTFLGMGFDNGFPFL